MAQNVSLMYLLDTNVISEIRKQKNRDENVTKWYENVKSSELFLSVLVMGEIRRGIELLRNRDLHQAQHLEQWLIHLEEVFGDRILGVDARVADEWGRISSMRPTPVIDCILVATAKVHQLTLVTRNVNDVAGLGADTFNPFE